ncbi:MAG: hypothetical protein K2M08_07830 [Anaeroplasmataceae bacterium]|nr:hypothetical protein [Anaeroplasmataceae bacterium]
MIDFLYGMFVEDDGENLRLNELGTIFAFFLAGGLFLNLFVIIFFLYGFLFINCISLLNFVLRSDKNMIGFRFHRGSLKDAMETYEEFKSLEDLYKELACWCKDNLHKDLDFLDFYVNLYGNTLLSNPLGEDSRISWTNTFIVGANKIGVLGFMTILADKKEDFSKGRANW